LSNTSSKWDAKQVKEAALIILNVDITLTMILF
jgi:hypothetical protein